METFAKLPKEVQDQLLQLGRAQGLPIPLMDTPPSSPARGQAPPPGPSKRQRPRNEQEYEDAGFPSAHEQDEDSDLPGLLTCSSDEEDGDADAGDEDWCSDSDESESDGFESESDDGEDAADGWAALRGHPATPARPVRPPRPPNQEQMERVKQALQRLCRRRVTVYGRDTAFQDLLRLQAERLVDTALQPGSHVLASPEQTDKSMMEAAIAVTCAIAKRPCIMIVKDSVANTISLVEKVNSVLAQLGLEARYASGKVALAKIESDLTVMSAMRSGRLLPILPATSCAIAHVNDFIERTDLSGLTLILDEADAIWTTHMTPRALSRAGGAFELGATQREAGLYRLIGMLPRPLNHNLALGPVSRVATLVQVSATNMATAQFHSMWRLPFQHLVVGEAEVQSQDFTTCLDVEPFKMGGQEVFLLMSSSGNNYNMNAPEFEACVRAFAEDPRNPRLMTVCTTPRVNNGAGSSRSVGNTTAVDLARKCLALCPNGKALISVGAGVVLLESANQELGAVNKDTVLRWEPPRGQRQGRKYTLKEAIEHCDRTFGLETPLFCVGYTCMQRCVSARSTARVPTHAIVTTCKGKTTADTRQMIMRVGGYTKLKLHEYGFEGKVTLLTTKEDYAMLQNLYKFTAEVLRIAGTGKPEDVTKWMDEQYDEVFRPVLRAARPHATKRLCLDEELSRARLAGDQPSGSGSGAESIDLTADSDDEVGQAPGPSAVGAEARDAFLLLFYRNWPAASVRYEHTGDEAGLACTTTRKALLDAGLLCTVGNHSVRLTEAGLARARGLEQREASQSAA